MDNKSKFKELIHQKSELTKQLRTIDRQIYYVIRNEHEKRYYEALESGKPPLSNWVTDFEKLYTHIPSKSTRDDAATIARYEAIIEFLSN